MFSCDSEILTDSGFHGVESIRADPESYKLLSKNTNTGNIFYRKPNSIEMFWVNKEDIYSIEGQSISARLTKDSLLFASKSKNGAFDLLPVNQLFDRQYFWLTNKIFWDGDVEVSQLKPDNISSGIDWLHLVTIRLFSGTRAGNGYVFYRHLEELKDILDRNEISYIYNSKSSIVIENQKIVCALSKFQSDKLRTIPSEYLRLNIEELQEFVDCIMRYNTEKLSSWHFCRTYAPLLACGIQELLLKLGFNARLRVWHPRRPNNSIHIIDRTVQYCVTFNKKDWIKIYRTNRKIKKDSGQFAKVDNGGNLFMIRRNGKCFWYGEN